MYNFTKVLYFSDKYMTKDLDVEISGNCFDQNVTIIFIKNNYKYYVSALGSHFYCFVGGSHNDNCKIFQQFFRRNFTNLTTLFNFGRQYIRKKNI
ncbi:hypothetical protein acsn021_37620 [Anaerocolumna cellulosilytica]|uniref:Uncharacterized protein n=1 Tax=Anaerocolumna cellulosilytica TaxID=433286 RepID=A0A6S6QYA4_9FIRM|nr:hypothetical protein acsn021_37620 [Anaerocolumna cellulosilytica]